MDDDDDDDDDGLVPEICATRESFYAPSHGMRERRAALSDLMHFPPLFGRFLQPEIASPTPAERSNSILHG